jgi:DNA invertase Pin-like site-specific DNA recombinase
MSRKITADHLARGAVVYVRQSTLGQVAENRESQRRQYALASTAKDAGFASVSVIDEDLGRSGSGLVERPGFQKLVGLVCSASIGAVYCIEASRLARNGRDWHHLIDLCALVGALVIDPDGTYDPKLVNDRLLLGLKGTMSEYELSLLRQRGLAARDAKAARGELRYTLPPGYCWNEIGQIEIDPDERVAQAIRLVFAKFRELGSARQVLLWARDEAVRLPVIHQGPQGGRIDWRAPAYHTVIAILKHPIYAGAYVFGRTTQRTSMVAGRARKTEGHKKPRAAWNVLLHDHHPGYISWADFEENQKMLAENAHMKKRAARKSARGGRALLSGLVRCGRCGRMMRVFYGSGASHAHRYQCRGDDAHGGTGLCIGIGGVRVDRAVAAKILEAVSDHGIEAALCAAERSRQNDEMLCQAVRQDLEEARYEASLAARRYEAVDPTKRLVARELEARWNSTLERVVALEARLEGLAAEAGAGPRVDRAALMALAHDLPAAWNAASADPRTKQRITALLIQEVMIDLDDQTHEAVVTMHWTGGRHSQARIVRPRCGSGPGVHPASPVEVVRKLAGQWPDGQLAMTMNRMRCKSADGQSWTAVRVRGLRERLGLAAFDPDLPRPQTVTVDAAARCLGICVGSVTKLIREGVLPAKQVMPSAPWQIPVSALTSQSVKLGVKAIIKRRPRNYKRLQDDKTLKLPGL